jgi:hypothetical protein
MPFVPATNCAEIIIQATLNGQDAITTFAARHATGWGATELAALADAVDIYWSTFALPNLPATYTYINTHVRDLRTSVGLQHDSAAGAGNGSEGGTPLPNNVTVAVARRSGLAGRSARGRVFMPGITQTGLATENTITTSFRDTLLDLFNGFTTAISLVDWEEVILSRQHDGVSLTEATVYTVIEYAVVNLVLDSIRRRLPGRGA